MHSLSFEVREQLQGDIRGSSDRQIPENSSKPSSTYSAGKAARSASDETTRKVRSIFYLGIHRSELTQFAHLDGASSADLVEKNLRAASLARARGQVIMIR
jgi:hypothetical protein